MDDETKLIGVADMAVAVGIPVAIFREEDLNDQATAIAFVDTVGCRRVYRHLPLALAS